MAENLPNQEAFDRALEYFDECKGFHQDLIEKVEERYKAYKAIVDKVSNVAEWTSKLYPPYIMHIVETSLASLVDDRLRYRIRPRATLATYLDPSKVELARMGAEAHQILSDWQNKQSKLQAELRPLMLQERIAGITVAKTFWQTREERRRQLVPEEVPLYDQFEMPIFGPDGRQLTRVRLAEKEVILPVYDGPITETRDIHDFMWHEAATKLSNARYLIDRVYMDPEEFFAGFEGEAPIFGPEHGGWPLEKARQILGTTKDGYRDEHANRWDETPARNTTRNLLEILEVWDTVRNEVTTIANRAVLASFKTRFPFFFEAPPFVSCSTQGDLFRVVGISQVEKVMSLQRMIWDVMNQRLDNLRLINNAVFFYRPDLEDPDAYELEPGAMWPMEDPQQVGQWSPNPIPAEISLGAEALVKGDMQNLSGGMPFTSGTDSQFVDQKTATGASIVTQIAQRSISMAKQSVYEALEKIGQQRIVMNQQFIREPTVAPVLGVDDEEELRVIMPQLLQGDYSYEVEPMADAFMKQEDQASAQALFQLGMSAVPVITPLAQAGFAQAINTDALWEDVLKAFGRDDYKRYFRSTAPPVAPPTTGTPPAPGSEQPPQGVTGEGSIDPAVSPSSNMTLSPIAHLQRAQALSRGGEMNV